VIYSFYVWNCDCDYFSYAEIFECSDKKTAATKILKSAFIEAVFGSKKDFR
jgi:hypothetical protein